VKEHEEPGVPFFTGFLGHYCSTCGMEPAAGCSLMHCSDCSSVCIWGLFLNTFSLAVAGGLEKSGGVSQAAAERTPRGGLGGPAASTPTEPRGQGRGGGVSLRYLPYVYTNA